MKKQIPNLITLGNLMCGTIAVWCVMRGELTCAGMMIFAGIVLDFFDGFAARMLGVTSQIGKELDSLADAVTSGVAPGFIAYSVLERLTIGGELQIGVKYVAILIPLFACYRLAKFNIDTRQSHSFLGLPAPAQAIVWAAIGISATAPEWQGISLIATRWVDTVMTHEATIWVLVAVEIILCILMVSEVPMFALKFKDFGWRENKIRYIFLLLSAALLVLFGIASVPLIIFCYIILSLITK